MVSIKQHVSAYREAIIRFTILAIRTSIHCGTVWLDVEISSSKIRRAYIKQFVRSENPVGAVDRATWAGCRRGCSRVLLGGGVFAP